MLIPSRLRAFLLALAAAAACGGSLAAVHYHRIGLTLSHYDARGHLVVARRIFDSLTPGWQQIGAVWPPLPHLLNALPVQLDVLYRSGASGVAISIAAFAAAVAGLAWTVATVTRSRWAGIAAASAFALNPNVLYLQSTPMTEPLLIGLTTLAVASLTEWCARSCDPDRRLRDAALEPAPARSAGETFQPRLAPPATIGIFFALACLTRYEAWPVTACALALGALALLRAGIAWRDTVSAIGAIGAYPASAIAAFAVFSRLVIGEWFVAGGFFVPENTALGNPFEALAQIGWGIRELSGYALLTIAVAGLAAAAVLSLVTRSRLWIAVPLSLAATAALPWFAFFDGHPYRIRYMAPLVAAQALGIGFAAGFAKRIGPTAAIALVLLSILELRPLDASAPMVVEAQWDRPNVATRERITACLSAAYSGDTVMASLGSLGHYVQELASAGIGIDHILHEGNGDIWLAALEHPRPYARWILIEEQAEGGDMLAQIAHRSPQFLDGYSRLCDEAGLALYKRN